MVVNDGRGEEGLGPAGPGRLDSSGHPRRDLVRGHVRLLHCVGWARMDNFSLVVKLKIFGAIVSAHIHFMY